MLSLFLGLSMPLGWLLIPGSPVQHAAGFLLVGAAPLLEVKGDACGQALVTNGSHPIRIHGSRVRTALAARPICEARFIIADLSTRNPNVMYELGIAHTVGKETVLIHQTAGTERFPFDISHFRIIDYQDTAIGGTTLKTRLEATIDNVIQKN